MKLTILLLLCCGAVFAQLPPKQSVTVTLANVPAADTVKEMTALVKTVGKVMDVSYDEASILFC